MYIHKHKVLLHSSSDISWPEDNNSVLVWKGAVNFSYIFIYRIFKFQPFRASDALQASEGRKK